MSSIIVEWTNEENIVGHWGLKNIEQHIKDVKVIAKVNGQERMVLNSMTLIYFMISLLILLNVSYVIKNSQRRM
jgi:hypothetical protein